jgi:hypothetical protein
LELGTVFILVIVDGEGVGGFGEKVVKDDVCWDIFDIANYIMF